MAFSRMRVLCGAAVLATCGLSSAVTINFDELGAMDFTAGGVVPVGAQLSDQYLNTLGVVFSSGAGYVAVVDLDALTSSSPNGIGGTTTGGLLTYTNANPITATFFDPTDSNVKGLTDSVSVTGDLVGFVQDITLEAYDVNGLLIDSDTAVDAGGTILTVTSTGALIHSVRILGGPSDDNGVAWDNFTFNTVTPVPEPGTMAALGLGAALLLRKRRRS